MNLIYYLRRIKSRIDKRYLREFLRKKYSILSRNNCNKFIFESLKSNKPFFVTRLGDGEMKAIEFYLSKWQYDEKLKYALENNAGFFPANDDNINDFAKIYIDAIKLADVVGVWFNPYEINFIKKYNKNAKLCTLGDMSEPFFMEKPWSLAFEGKKVLVIHPFVESIKKQFGKKDKLFNKKVLPKFELILFKSIQTAAGERDDRFKSWFEALNYMKNEISKIDFDIAVIGAGAYGLPLGAFIKSLGKKAIHLGGATQILFGVKGKRWENIPRYKEMFNEHWIIPIEKPKNFKKIENGCYW